MKIFPSISTLELHLSATPGASPVVILYIDGPETLADILRSARQLFDQQIILVLESRDEDVLATCHGRFRPRTVLHAADAAGQLPLILEKMTAATRPGRVSANVMQH